MIYKSSLDIPISLYLPSPFKTLIENIFSIDHLSDTSKYSLSIKAVDIEFEKYIEIFKWFSLFPEYPDKKETVKYMINIKSPTGFTYVEAYPTGMQIFPPSLSYKNIGKISLVLYLKFKDIIETDD